MKEHIMFSLEPETAKRIRDMSVKRYDDLKSMSRLIEDLVNDENQTDKPDIEAIKADRQSRIDEYISNEANGIDSCGACGLGVGQFFACTICGAEFKALPSDAKFCPACGQFTLESKGLNVIDFSYGSIYVWEMSLPIINKRNAEENIKKQKVKVDSMKEGKKKQNALNKLKQMEEDFEDKYVLMRPTRRVHEYQAEREARKAESIVDEPAHNEAVTSSEMSEEERQLLALYNKLSKAKTEGLGELNLENSWFNVKEGQIEAVDGLYHDYEFAWTTTCGVSCDDYKGDEPTTEDALQTLQTHCKECKERRDGCWKPAPTIDQILSGKVKQKG